MRNALIMILAGLLVFVSWRLVKVEREWYAMAIGMCPGRVSPRLLDLECVSRTEGRTSWMWDLYYGLTD